jgi:hypothetical protein
MKRNLKLFVWEGVFCDWTCGVAFALAETPEEARAILTNQSKDWEKEEFKTELSSNPKVYEDKMGIHTRGGG